MSRETAASETQHGAGPSNATPSRGGKAVKCAAAAERRLAKRGYELPSEVEEVDMFSASSSEEEAISKGKGKGKGKAKAKVKPVVQQNKTMTITEMKRLKRMERSANRAEEKRLRKQLGRKLTRAEKTTIALHKHHPELRDVWGDLEKRVKPVTPDKAEQPQELKILLLPFQQESLYWMRKQEEGVWRGGMLAVSQWIFSFSDDSSLTIKIRRMRWGKVHSRLYYNFLLMKFM